MDTPHVSLDYVEAVLQKDSNNAEAWRIKGDHMVLQTNFSNAMHCYTKSIVCDPSYQDAWIGKGIVSIYLNNNIDAKQCFDKAMFLHDDNRCNLLQLVSHTFLWNKNNSKKIFRFLDESEECCANSPDTLFSKGLFFKLLGERKNAKPYFDKVLETNPDDLLAKISLHQIESHDNSIQNTIEFLNTVADTLSDDYLTGVSDEMFLRMDFDNAILLYDYLILKKNILMLDKKLALAYLIRNDIKSALDHIDIYISKFDDSDALTRKGEILRRRNNIDDALECFQKSINLDPNNAEAWRRKGFTHSMRHEDFASALDSIDESLKIDPYHPMTYVQKANFLRRDNTRWDDALSCLDRALEIDPTFVLAWKQKGDLFRSMHSYGTAMTCYDNIVQLDPDDVQIWYNSCVVKAKFAESEYQKGSHALAQNNLPESLEHFDKVLSVDPNDIDTLKIKLGILQKLNRTEDCIQCTKRIQELED